MGIKSDSRKAKGQDTRKEEGVRMAFGVREFYYARQANRYLCIKLKSSRETNPELEIVTVVPSRYD
jgi:hypothetical protein